jgi:hypothetical protein
MAVFALMLSISSPVLVFLVIRVFYVRQTSTSAPLILVRMVRPALMQSMASRVFVFLVILVLSAKQTSTNALPILVRMAQPVWTASTASLALVLLGSKTFFVKQTSTNAKPQMVDATLRSFVPTLLDLVSAKVCLLISFCVSCVVLISVFRFSSSDDFDGNDSNSGSSSQRPPHAQRYIRRSNSFLPRSG